MKQYGGCDVSQTLLIIDCNNLGDNIVRADTVDRLQETCSSLGLALDEFKHYATNQYHLEHYGLYPKASKYSGWQ